MSDQDGDRKTGRIALSSLRVRAATRNALREGMASMRRAENSLRHLFCKETRGGVTIARSDIDRAARDAARCRRTVEALAAFDAEMVYDDTEIDDLVEIPAPLVEFIVPYLSDALDDMISRVDKARDMGIESNTLLRVLEISEGPGNLFCK